MSTSPIPRRLRSAGAHVVVGLLTALTVVFASPAVVAPVSGAATAGGADRVEPECHARTHPGEECSSFPFR